MAAQLHALLAGVLRALLAGIRGGAAADRHRRSATPTSSAASRGSPMPASSIRWRRWSWTIPSSAGSIPRNSCRETLRHCASAAIVSDGDTVYQPRKIEPAGWPTQSTGRSWLTRTRKTICRRSWSAAGAVLCDCGRQTLAACKRLHPHRFVTVQVLQGHYAARPLSSYHRPHDLCASETGCHLATAPEARS